jgi:hypothetical protein
MTLMDSVNRLTSLSFFIAAASAVIAAVPVPVPVADAVDVVEAIEERADGGCLVPVLYICVLYGDSSLGAVRAPVVE